MSKLRAGGVTRFDRLEDAVQCVMQHAFARNAPVAWIKTMNRHLDMDQIRSIARDEGRGHRPESVTRHLRRPSTMTAGGAVAATAETTGVGMEPLMATTADRIDITAADVAGCIGTP